MLANKIRLGQEGSKGAPKDWPLRECSSPWRPPESNHDYVCYATASAPTATEGRVTGSCVQVSPRSLLW